MQNYVTFLLLISLIYIMTVLFHKHQNDIPKSEQLFLDVDEEKSDIYHLQKQLSSQIEKDINQIVKEKPDKVDVKQLENVKQQIKQDINLNNLNLTQLDKVQHQLPQNQAKLSQNIQIEKDILLGAQVEKQSKDKEFQNQLNSDLKQQIEIVNSLNNNNELPNFVKNQILQISQIQQENIDQEIQDKIELNLQKKSQKLKQQEQKQQEQKKQEQQYNYQQPQIIQPIQDVRFQQISNAPSYFEVYMNNLNKKIQNFKRFKKFNNDEQFLKQYQDYLQDIKPNLQQLQIRTNKIIIEQVDWSLSQPIFDGLLKGVNIQNILKQNFNLLSFKYKFDPQENLFYYQIFINSNNQNKYFTLSQIFYKQINKQNLQIQINETLSSPQQIFLPAGQIQIKQNNKQFQQILSEIKPQLEIFLNDTFKYIECDNYTQQNLVLSGQQDQANIYQNARIYNTIVSTDKKEDIKIKFQYNLIIKNNQESDFFIIEAEKIQKFSAKDAKWDEPQLVEKISDYSQNQLKNKKVMIGKQIYHEDNMFFDQTPIFTSQIQDFKLTQARAPDDNLNTKMLWNSKDKNKKMHRVLYIDRPDLTEDIFGPLSIYTGQATNIILAKDKLKDDPMFDFINTDNPLKSTKNQSENNFEFKFDEQIQEKKKAQSDILEEINQI